MRLFIALSLPRKVERELWAYMEKLRRANPRAGRFSRRENLHLTLGFIGEAEEEAARRIAMGLLELPSHSLSMDLAGVGRFRSGILWAGLREKEELGQMSHEARDLLKRLSIPFDEKPFRAHITLARDWRGPDPEELPVLPKMSGLATKPIRACLFESYHNERGAVCYRLISPEELGLRL